MTRPPALPRSPAVGASVALAALVAFGAARFEHFGSPGNLSAVALDYSAEIIAALGATLVVMAGGIDLSVGSVAGFAGVLVVTLVERGWHPLGAGAVALACGASLGGLNGAIIQLAGLPAFLVTLVSMFAVRAACFLLLDRSASLAHPFVDRVAGAELDLGAGVSVPAHAWIMLAALAACLVLARATPLGVAIRALGGAEGAAGALGVPIARTRICVYSFAGACSALAGLAATLQSLGTKPDAGTGLELTVIAAVVIGGTPLSGGTGTVLGTVVGVLIAAFVRALITFHGDLNAAWTSVATGVLLLGFAGAQRGLTAVARSRAP